MQSFIVLLIAVAGASSALSFQHFLLADDGSSIIDEAIDTIKSMEPNEFSFGNMDLDFDRRVFSSIRLTDVRFRSLRSLRRISPVVSKLGAGNLTLTTDVGLKDFLYDCTLKLEAFGLETQVLANVNVSQNVFSVSLTLYSDPKTGQCRVYLPNGKFTALSGIIVNLQPIGFFNQIKLDASINHVQDAILKDLNEGINLSDFQRIIEKRICEKIPN